MMKNHLGTLIFAFLISFLGQNTIAEMLQHDKYIVCFVTSWALYRNEPYGFRIKDIDPTLCSHLVYAYAHLKNDTVDEIVTIDPYADLKINDYGHGQYNQITSLKKKHPHLKISLCMGGNDDKSISYSRLAESSQKRSDFAKNAAAFLKQHNFDGLDIHWKFPSKRGGRPNDKQNFPKLLEELKTEFDKHNLLLTTTLTGMISMAAYDLPSIAQFVNWVHLSEFQFHSPYDQDFGINAPLESNDEDNVKTSLDYYLNGGLPRHKIVMGIAAFGYGFENTNKPGKATALTGYHTDPNGLLAFHEVCEKVNDRSSWPVEWDTISYTPIAINGNKKISYDDQKSVQRKVRYVMEKQLLGVYLFSLDSDDFVGSCSLTTYGEDNKYPLLKTINMEFGGSLGVSNLLNATIIAHKFPS